ncbi:MAG: NAD-dependent epimerase/dehydratase family protein, partial [Dehalococcoidia bacterium]
MKCLVTGGAGFIGSNIVEALLARGEEVTVLDNFTTGLKTNLPDNKNLNVITGDVLDLDLVKSCVQNIDVVFHLAAEVGNLKSFQDPQRDARVNILGTINILQSAVASGTKRVVYSASSAIFGEPQYLPIDEPHPIAP